MQWLKKYYSEKCVHNKYNHLLIGMVVLFLIAPLYLATGLRFPLIAFLLFNIVQLALRATVTDKKRLKHYTILTLTGLACTLISRYAPVDPIIAGAFYTIGRAIYVVFLVIAIQIFVKKLFAARIVTSDRVKGSICVYFLMGVVCTFLYEVIYFFDSTAFQVDQVGPMTFVYYSYSVLTTLGFGDITPLDHMAISVTCLQAITGQMYLVIFIARLIGVYISQEHTQLVKEARKESSEA
ncbi:MAG: ion channel [Planctomycetota bacterium]|jgi:hypothetical protein